VQHGNRLSKILPPVCAVPHMERVTMHRPIGWPWSRRVNYRRPRP
jgi:hypothetical protein